MLKDVLMSAGCASLGMPMLSVSAGTATLQESELQAIALNYVADNSRVDPKKFPTFNSSQKCSNCALVQGRVGFWRPCTLFPKKLVFHNGWCRTWAAKS